MDSELGLLKFVQPERLPVALVLGLVLWLASIAITRLTDDLGLRFTAWRIRMKQLSAVARFGLLIGGTAAIVTSVVHLKSEVLLALGGSAAVALGFAFKDLLASLMAGLIVLFDRPFQVGDRVKVGVHYGEVVEIGLRTTRIVTLDDSVVSVPNSLFLTESVSSANAGALDQMCVLSFYLAADQDFVLAKRLVYEAVVTSRFVFLRKPVVVHVAEGPVPGLVSMTALHVVTRAYVMDGRFELDFGSDVHERVKLAFRHARLRTVGDLTAHGGWT